MEKIFSHSVGSLFTLLIVSFAEKKLFSLNLFQLLIPPFISCALEQVGPNLHHVSLGPDFLNMIPIQHLIAWELSSKSTLCFLCHGKRKGHRFTSILLQVFGPTYIPGKDITQGCEYKKVEIIVPP